MRPVNKTSFALFAALVCAPLVGLQPTFAKADAPTSDAKTKGSHEFSGMADYYHHSLYGKKTASGQVLAKHLYTAAHRTLPFGTHVHVKNHSNGKSCIVVINDRGPFTKSKVIDLSHSAAAELDMISAGTARVGCTVVPKPKVTAGVAAAKTDAPKVETLKVETIAKAKPSAEAVKAKPVAVAVKADPEAAIVEPAVSASEISVMSAPVPGISAQDRAALTTPLSARSLAANGARADETSAEIEGAIPVELNETP